MTLHEAIQEVLIHSNEPLSSGAIANAINAQALYKRRDGKEVAAAQVMARIAQYADLFEINRNGDVSLPSRSILAYKKGYKDILKILHHSKITSDNAKILAIALIYSAWDVEKGYSLFEDIIQSDPLPALSLLDYSAGRSENSRVFKDAIDLLLSVNKSIHHDISRVIYELRQIEKPDSDSFGNLVNSIANEYNASNKIHLGEHSTPPILSKFISSFYRIGSHARIFDPFAGNGSSLIETFKYNKKQKPTIIGNDISELSFKIGNLNLISNGCKQSYYYHTDAFNQVNGIYDIDLIVTNPPFGGKISIDKHFFNDVHNDVLYHLGFRGNGNLIDMQISSIVLVISLLKNSGKAVMVIPDGVLFSSKRYYFSVRQYLVNSKMVKGIISLPRSVFKPYSGIACSVLILDREHNSEEIFISDTSSYSVDAFENASQLIIDAFHSKEIDIPNTKRISYDQVIDSNYDLSPKRYLAEQSFDGSYQTIKELTTLVHTGSVVAKDNLNRQWGIPFLQVGDLPDTNGLNEIDLNSADSFISDEGLLSKNPNYIPDAAVLVTKVGSKLKPVLYKHIGDALCNPHIIVIKTNPELLLPEYLITQLQSDYVLKQIDVIRHDIGVPHFSKIDFLSIKIKVLPLEAQRRFIASFYGKKLQEEKKLTDRQREDDLYNIIASLKHELKQPISSFGMDIDAIKDFLDEKIVAKQPIQWNEPIVELLPGENIEDSKNSLLANVVDRMQAAVAEAQATLSKAEEILNIGIGMFAPEKFAIKKFITSVIKSKFDNANCTINIKGEEQEIYADKYQIEILFKLLLENAIKHGFKKSGSKQSNIINIRFPGKSITHEFNEIIVENNGAPFSEGFDINKFQTLGHTSNRHRGSGFGGFHIKRIIENHKGEIYIASASEIRESDFKVRFKIYLP